MAKTNGGNMSFHIRVNDFPVQIERRDKTLNQAQQAKKYKKKNDIFEKAVMCFINLSYLGIAFWFFVGLAAGRYIGQ